MAVKKQELDTSKGVTKVKVKQVEPTEPPLKEGNDFKVFVEGLERWLCKDGIEVLLQQGKDVEIPKGSPYTPPPHFVEKENCRGCGKKR